MSPSKGTPTNRLAIHSTHEAAEKIAGIGAVLDGILPQPEYQEAFPRSLLAGPYPFPDGTHPLKDVLFDSNLQGGGAREAACPKDLTARLQRIAEDLGTRIVLGRRTVGPRGAEAQVDVLLVCPSGLRRSKLDEFARSVRERFDFGIAWYQDNYCAIHPVADTSLDRILRHYEELRRGAGAPPSPPDAELEPPLLDHRGHTLFGGVPFVGSPSGDPAEDRAAFPPIRSLDSFSGSEKTNPYLVELEFYFHAALPLWQATRALLEVLYRPEEITLFVHDWLGVPLFWAQQMDGDFQFVGPRRSISTVYFAHEARIARLLVEGTIKDKKKELCARCHPDGHDVSFYSYLSTLEAASPPPGLDTAFPEVRGPWGARAFDDIYYHVLNRQAGRCDRIIAVGKNVQRETELILRGGQKAPPVSLCPNGIPDFTPGPQAKGSSRGPGAETGPRPAEVLAAKQASVTQARERIAEFCRATFGFRPDFIFTGVNRCELSKAPWRNVEFFRAFVEAAENKDKKALFIWLSRPKPLPTAEQVARASEYRWPIDHRPLSAGGDLRKEEEVLWEMIRQFNAKGTGRYHLLYVNQFGWSREKLGGLDVGATTFLDLRMGTDVEVGLSIYEPFGIAPLEPFSSGAVCVLSDSSGCALHLSELRAQNKVSDAGFVIGRFTRERIDPSRVDLNRLAEIEAEAYAEMTREVLRKLRVRREDRLAVAQQAMPHLSWATATRYLLEALDLAGPER